MSYLAYELAEGDARREVERLCRHAARASGAFSSSTVPDAAAVEQYLTTSYHWIRTRLIKAGLSDDQTDADVVGVLQQLQVYDVCMKVELALPTEAAGGNPSDRWTTFKELRDEMAMMISDGSLSGIGAEEIELARRTPFVGGISRERKRLMREDSDAIQHRVQRDQFRKLHVIPTTRDGVQLEVVEEA